jgi:hypothetical protein
MKTLIHKTIITLLYSAIIIGLIHWAYKDGPSDTEMRIRASQPLSAP